MRESEYNNNSTLLSAAFKEKLREYKLNLLKSRGSQVGSRSSRQTGRSLEWADFRSYSPGDELKKVDFKAYARLKKLYVKVYEDEEAGNFLVLLDRSKSLNFGNPTKLATAKKIALLIAFLSLNHRERMTFIPLPLQDEKPFFLQHFDHYGYFEEQLNLLGPAGKLPAYEELRFILESVAFRGGIYFISDLYLSYDFTLLVRLLKSHSQAFTVVAIESQEEIAPEISGEVRVSDLESDQQLNFNFRRDTLSLYQKKYQDYFRSLTQKVKDSGGSFFSVSNQEEDSSLLLRLLKEGVIS